MVKVAQLTDASILDEPKATPKAPSPATVERQKQMALFRDLLARLTDDTQVFQVSLEPGDKAATVRLRLLRAAQEAGREIAVRRHGNGFAVGLMTPARRTRRGRP